MERTYSIQFVSKITGINPHTIRAWEKRYQAVVPKRAPKGKRLYSEKDVDRLKKLNELVKLGNAISDVAVLDDNGLLDMYNEFVTTSADLSGVSEFSISDSRNKVLTYINEKNFHDVITEIDTAKRKLSLEEFAIYYVDPLVCDESLSITNLHFLSSVFKAKLGEIVFNSNNQNQLGELIVLATPSNEEHELGTLISAALCMSKNKKVLYLGPNLPARELANVVNELSPTKLIFGVQDVDNFKNYIEELNANISYKVEILAGGNPKLSTISASFEHIESFEQLLQKIA